MTSNKWQKAILDQLAIAEIEDDCDLRSPAKVLQELIDWHVMCALDPAISDRAQALVDRGMRYQRQGRTATKREWVGLNDVEIVAALTDLPHFRLYFLQIARAVEGALKEKNTDAVIGFLGTN
jgi:hypothetical protein